MNLFMLFAIVMLLGFGLTNVAAGQDAMPPCIDTDICCNFSKYRPLKEPHALLKAVLKKVDPKYPAAAKSVRVGGKVVVRILVNRKGDVIETCVVKGHPFLRAASEEAAKEWKFKKNFGFVDSKLKQLYAETDLIFSFVP